MGSAALRSAPHLAGADCLTTRHRRERGSVAAAVAVAMAGTAMVAVFLGACVAGLADVVGFGGGNASPVNYTVAEMNFVAQGHVDYRTIPWPDPEVAGFIPADLAPTSAATARLPSTAATFPWGECTWFVAQRRLVTWRGNAADWLENAAAQGWPTASEPTVGAIVVYRRGGTYDAEAGHVALVVAASGN